MQGSPDPILGTDALNAVAATLVACCFVALPYALRKRVTEPRRLALVGGLAYAVVCLGAWVGARLVADAFVGAMVADPGTFLGWILAGAVVLGAQAAVPYYCLARWRLIAPLAALFGVTVLVLPAFLSVRGESDPLALYALVFGPLLIGLTCLGGLAEYAVRSVVVAE
ncbi:MULTISPECIES: hypothetical protein [Halorussus]|uniref:hypothetical protein n=1 Tax=Halorussus TaxID=1070314 RepID=UPI000E2151D7|nr:MULTISPECIES: hypothetical protein [Halorussus]NHN59072.1 hypothetical protein [Halorussus sp. JP-T4]